MKITTIGEAGINHNGDLDIAKKLIFVGAAAGCKVIKFQKRTPDICVPENQKNIPKDTPWGKMTYLEYKHRIEFGKKEYDEIRDYCKQIGTQFSVSVWDTESLQFILDNYKDDVPWIKIPSAKISDLELVKACGESGKQIIMSTGMSDEKEINDCVQILKKYREDLVIMHTNSSYPCETKFLNIRRLLTLKKKYPFAFIGYSGHETLLGTTINAAALAASIVDEFYIERHFCLDKNQWGTDIQSSLSPWGLFKLISGLNELCEALGDDKVGCITEAEKPIRAKLRG